MNKRILVVVENIDVNKSSGAKANVALIKNLALCGYKVHVLHYTLKQIEIEGVECVSIKEIRSSSNFIASRLERLLRNKFKIDIHGPLEKIWGFSFTLFNDRNSIIKAIKKVDFAPDLVFTLSQGGSFRPHHALLKLPEFHNKWVAYIHDPYPMHLYPRPYVWVEPGYYKKWRFVKEMSLKAAFPAFPSQLLKEWMGSYFKGYKERGIVIPHQLNIDVKEETSSNIEEWNVVNFNVLHAGSLLHARDPRALLSAFKDFIDKIGKREAANCYLYFIGIANNHKGILENYANQLSQIKFIDKSVDFNIVYAMQQQAAVNVILEAKSEISPFLPGKFPHCVAADKPIFSLSPYYSEVRRLLGEDYPYCCEADDKANILEFLEISYSNWKSGKGTLNRPDLEVYLSKDYLKKVISHL